MPCRSLTLCLLLSASLGGPPVASADAGGKRPAFQEGWLTPYLAQGKGAEARQALLAGQRSEGIRLLRLALQERGQPQGHQASYLLAHALLADGQFALAAQRFGQLVTRYPLLRDHHRYYGARALLGAKRYAEAAAEAGRIAAGSALAGRARVLQAQARWAAGQRSLSAALWRAYLQKNPRGAFALQAHLRLGQAQEAEARALKGRPAQAALREALAHYKVVLIAAEGTGQGRSAEQRIAQLARQLPGGREAARLTPEEQLRQAMVHVRRMRNREAELALGKILKLSGLSAATRCKAAYHMANSVFRQRQRDRAEPMFVKAEALCRRAKDTDLTVKSLYNGARGLVRKGRFTQAIARYGIIERDFPGHSYADDARLRAAEAYEEGKKLPQMRRTLATLAQKYPGGDMVREALWRLARDAHLHKRTTTALHYLDRIIDKLGRAEIYYAHGRALYWKARILDLRGRRRAARQGYVRCLEEYPLSYYALLSLNRLYERHRKTYEAQRERLLVKIGQGSGAWRFAPRALFGNRAFLRGVELARLGFGEDAVRELRAAGVQIRAGVPPRDLWLAAVLYDRAGLWHLSHRVPRRLDPAYSLEYPLGENYRRWAISYPRAFLPLVQEHAAREGVPWELVLAVMREESGFNPRVESWANAVGLMQLILPTARAAGERHGLTVTRAALQDPRVNIRLGATYLGFLLRGFKGALPLAVAGYNAGEGATFGWLQRFGDIDLDELVERIPYDQTRDYTKRVMASLLTYRMLYAGGRPDLPRVELKLPQVTRQDFRAARAPPPPPPAQP